mgnify:FL=1
MATEIVPLGTFGQRCVEAVSGSQLTIDNTLTVVTGSAMDIRGYSLVSYTLSVATQTLKVAVYLANKLDFSDEFDATSTTGILAVTVASGVVRWTGSIATTFSPTATSAALPVPFGFIRLKIQPNVNDVHGTLTFSGIAKNA